MNKLRQKVRNEVLREKRELRTREQIIIKAQRLHELSIDVSALNTSRDHDKNVRIQEIYRTKSKPLKSRRITIYAMNIVKKIILRH